MRRAKSFINFNTNQPENTRSVGKPRVLVVPLDWGLGHTTRCIPVIKELLNQGAEVFAAGTDAQKRVLIAEFPGLPFLDLPGYEISYSWSKRGFAWRILRQLPKINRAIQSEKQWLAKMLQEYHFDFIISDNRFGLYTSLVPCIFITHQLSIQSPFGTWSEKILQKWNYRQINRFTECWIPDNRSDESLAGELSHPAIMPVTPIRYIGHLSRFEEKISGKKNNHLLVILSGPEPQRTLLEDKIINALVYYNGTAEVVRALPTTEKFMPSTNQLHFYNHLTAAELNEKIMEAEFVISRCGYSTVMDLVKLKKKSILIPTPGQTEQEYLATYLSEKGIAYCVSHDDFSLEKDIAKARQFPYRFPSSNDASLKEAITELLKRRQ